jgi:hypothetical protein
MIEEDISTYHSPSKVVAETVVKVNQGLWQPHGDLLFCNAVQTAEGDSSQPIKSYSK